MRLAPLLTVCTALCITGSALAQSPAPRQPAAQTQPAQAQAQPGQAARPQVPDPISLIVMIRTTMVALNQANLTGNYSVLREISAPIFQAQNSQAQLAVAFTTLRDQRLDLSSVVAVTPELTDAPAVDDNGILRVTGFFPTEPLRVNFQLAYQLANGQWRPIGMSVGTTQAPQKAPAAAENQAGKKQAPAPARPKQ